MSRRYLHDTGPAFDVLFGRRGVDVRARETRRRGAKVGICLPVLGEIVAGVEGSASRDASMAVVRRALGQFVFWPFDTAAAYEFGRLYAYLKRTGRPMQQVDIQIAAIALTLGNCTVVTSDSDLSAVPGLRVENWAV
jgi:tRNA(fMet)-specific endonuclease VapC